MGFEPVPCLSVHFIAEKAYGTGCSQAVPHPSTILARRCLTSVIRWERVCSSWYGRRRQTWISNATLHLVRPVFVKRCNLRIEITTTVKLSIIKSNLKSNTSRAGRPGTSLKFWSPGSGLSLENMSLQWGTSPVQKAQPLGTSPTILVPPPGRPRGGWSTPKLNAT